MDAILEQWQARLIPGLVALHEHGHAALDDRRLHCVERGEHPCDRARPGIGIVRQQPRMALRDMEYDRPRLEERQIAFLIGRNLPERMQLKMRGLLHRTERKKTNVVRLAHFFKRPANAHVPRQSPAAIGRTFKSGDNGGHCSAPWLLHNAVARHEDGYTPTTPSTSISNSTTDCKISNGA